MMPIRLATLDDVDRMHRVRTAVRENKLSDPAKITPEHYRTMLERDGRGWVYEQRGDIVGFAVADRRRRNVWALFVDPAHEGRGIGRVLHDTLLAWLFEVGDGPVWLTTGAGTRAERFYRRAGWTMTATLAGGELRFEIARPAMGTEAGGR